ncbi:MAG TPA: hypothetical protein VNW93_13990 [Mycobacterium sp.]|nr:hypothetical protein [Mycobacterium sp.]
MLVAPDAAVGGIDREQADTGPRGHAGEPVAEHCGGYARHRAAQPLPAFPAAHGFSTCRAGVGEIEVFDRDGGDAIPLAVVDQLGDGVADLSVATRRRSRQFEVDPRGCPYRVTVTVESA